MNVKALSLAAVISFIATISFSQADTTNLKLTNLQLSSAFTQHITVKGEELEKLPFSSLQEVIGIYFNGAYSNNGNLVFLVDGNPSPNINGYSIHDIESITLVQHAAILMDGLNKDQQLVLIKTRTNYQGKP